MRSGSTASSCDSSQASCSVAKATCPEKDAVRTKRFARRSGKQREDISAPIKAVPFCLPGRCMTPKAWRPSSNAPAKALLPCPIAEVTPRPVMSNSDGLGFFTLLASSRTRFLDTTGYKILYLKYSTNQYTMREKRVLICSAKHLTRSPLFKLSGVDSHQ